MIIKLSTITALAVTVCMLYSCENKSEQPLRPQPTDGTQIKWDMEEGSKKQAKAEWLKNMHRAAPGVVWQEKEQKNTWSKYKLHLDNITKSNDVTIGDDLVSGFWQEKGSSNQAGSIRNVAYDKQNDLLYAISDGGTLFRGDRDDNDWEVINQSLRFDPSFFEIISLGNNDIRLLSKIGNKLYFSNDRGITWDPVNGLLDGSGLVFKNPIVIESTSGNSTIFVLHKQGNNSNIRLMASFDNGLNWTNIKQFFTTDMDNLAMTQVIGSDDIYLIEQTNLSSSRLYSYNQLEQKLDIINFNSRLGFGEERGNLNGHMTQDTVVLTAYDDDNVIFQTKDFGDNWQEIGTLPKRPWSVGMYQSRHAPNTFYMGAVEAFVSYNYGADWEKVSEWWEYYDDVDYKLHADIMEFEEFTTKEDSIFWLVSNHGGISISTDTLSTNFNIGQNGLNVSQYYDVVTHPADANLVYAGTQDQGLQRGLLDDDGPAPFEQVISGDYGHGIFTGEDNAFWTVYPDGWVSFYEEPIEGYLVDSWQLPNPDGAVWIPPLVKSPFESESQDVIYLAGGSDDESEYGSYIQRLERGVSGISQVQYPFNFGEGGDRLTYLAFSQFDENLWYAITDQGKFYRSDSGGGNFELLHEQLPGAHYLYGAYILPSKVDPMTIYISGSGYSNAPVWVSHDNGMSFEPMSDGLPSTLVFELAATDNEELIFAASEAGPYVYVVNENKWFALDNGFAPNQTYWSVEYVSEIKTVRFGTYGRGIWDFQINTSVSSEEITKTNEGLSVFPNPTAGLTTLQFDDDDDYHVSIYSLNGKKILEKNAIRSSLEVDLTSHLAGNYIVVAKSNKKLITKQIIKQ